MAENKLTVELEQRDWERLQKLSERNGEPIERLAARFLAADLAKIFNKPPEVPGDSEVMKIHESFIQGQKQVESAFHSPKAELEIVNEPAVKFGTAI